MERKVLIKRIVENSKVNNLENLYKNTEIQPNFNLSDCAYIYGNGYIVLDFGIELCGNIVIVTGEVEETDMTEIRIRFGESLSEVYSSIGEKNSTNAHSPRDFTYYLPSWASLNLGGTGFRFVRIDFLKPYNVNIKSIFAMEKIFSELQPMYSYNGQDKRIEEIYQTAKRTIDLCACSGMMWDGIKRDRLVWIGDMHPETLAMVTMYGANSVIEKSLDFIKIQTPLPNWMNKIPSYSMWWIIIVADYYNLTNRDEFAKSQIPYLLNLLELIDSCVDTNGNINYPSYFVDWSIVDSSDEKVGVQAINIIAIKKAIILLDKFGVDTTLCKSILDKLNRKEIIVKEKKQVIALKYFATGKLDSVEYQKLIDGGAKGLSTFMSYYILTAIASKDKHLAVDIMKEYYGAMLDKGATTFWEYFDIEWAKNSSRIDEMPKNGQLDIHGDFGNYCFKGYRHSLCHGWSAGVIRFIKENC